MAAIFVIRMLAAAMFASKSRADLASKTQPFSVSNARMENP